MKEFKTSIAEDESYENKKIHNLPKGSDGLKVAVWMTVSIIVILIMLATC